MKIFGFLGRLTALSGVAILVWSVVLRAIAQKGPFGVSATNMMFLSMAVMLAGIALLFVFMSTEKPGK